MFISPPMISVLFVLILFMHLSSDSQKCCTVPEGCLYMDAIVILSLLYFKFRKIDSTLQFGQLQLVLSLLLLIPTSSNLSFLTRIPAPLFLDFF